MKTLYTSLLKRHSVLSHVSDCVTGRKQRSDNKYHDREWTHWCVVGRDAVLRQGPRF